LVAHIDYFNFVNKNWPKNPKVGCSKACDLVGTCEVESKLIQKIKAKFQNEVEWEEFLDFLITLFDVHFIDVSPFTKMVADLIFF